MTYVAFLRAINVGGRNLIPMAQLRAMFESLGFERVQTLMQSGNVIFDGKEQTPAKIQKLLEEESAKRFGFEVDYIVRTDKALTRIVANNPLDEFSKNDPGHFIVLFLKTDPPREAEKSLEAAIKGREVVLVRGDVAYAMYPDGAGTSKLTTAVLEKHLATRVTGRNWNTVRKLLEMARNSKT